MKKSGPGFTYLMAWCIECSKGWENYHTADKLAAAHAEKYSHRVRVEMGKVWVYDGRK